MTATTKIDSIRTALVVDDEPHVTELVGGVLTEAGFTVASAPDGLAALRRARAMQPDVIILDIGLPGLDGFDVCRTLRKETSAPILFLTARTQEIDRIVGLELGADDFIAKPFSPRELIARVRAVMRRSGVPAPEPANRRIAGDITIDLDRREVTRAGRPIRLKPREFELLWLFVRNDGRVFTRDQLIEMLWGYDFDGDPRTVDVHVRRIRRAIGDLADQPRYIHTVHGVGYRFTSAGVTAG
jgi:two-component system alkaline phosphatase synthesis response regulator PhoP